MNTGSHSATPQEGGGPIKENIFRFGRIVKDRYISSQLGDTSVLVAYYLLLSLIPLLMLAGNLLSAFSIEVESAIAYIETLVPQAVQPLFESLARDLLTRGSGGIVTFSIVGLLWTASKGINNLQMGANRAYGLQWSKSYVAKRFLSVLILALIVLLLLVLLVLFSFGEMLLDWLAPQAEWVPALLSQVRSLRWPATLLGAVLILTILYVMTPETKVRVRDALPGAVFAAAGLLLLGQLFALFVYFAARTLSSYGALSSFFIMLFWLHFSAGVVLAGAVLNASIQEYRFGPPAPQPNRIDLLVEAVWEEVQTRFKRRKGAQKRPKEGQKGAQKGAKEGPKGGENLPK